MVQYSFEHLVAKQLRQMKVRLPIHLVLTDEERILGADGALEGAVVVTSFTPTPAFTKKFYERYGVQPEVGSDSSFDSVMLIAHAMEQTGSINPTILKGFLKTLKLYDGVSGNLAFDGERGVTKPFRFFTIHGNTLIPIKDPTQP